MSTDTEISLSPYPLAGETERQFHDRQIKIGNAEYINQFAALSIPVGRRVHVIVECVDQYDSMGLFEYLVPREDGSFPTVFGCKVLKFGPFDPGFELRDRIQDVLNDFVKEYHIRTDNLPPPETQQTGEPSHEDNLNRG